MSDRFIYGTEKRLKTASGGELLGKGGPVKKHYHNKTTVTTFQLRMELDSDVYRILFGVDALGSTLR